MVPSNYKPSTEAPNAQPQWRWWEQNQNVEVMEVLELGKKGQLW